MQQKRALVLSGGGSKGAFQAGALKHLLYSLGLYYDIICGVSVGAINAIHIAQYKKGEERKCAEDMLKLWGSFNQKDIYKRWFPFGILHAAWQPALYNSAPLRQFLEEHIDINKIHGSGRELRFGTVSLDTGNYRLYDESSSDLIGACYNSASFPVAFMPTVMDGELQTDGGVRNVTPLGAAINAGATDIDVIMTSPENPKYGPLKDPNVIDVAPRIIDIMSDEIVRCDLVIAELINKLVIAGASDKKVINIRVIRPGAVLIENSLDFAHEKIEEMIKIGYEAAKTQLPQN